MIGYAFKKFMENINGIHNQELMCPLHSLAPSKKRDWMTIGSATKAPTIIKVRLYMSNPQADKHMNFALVNPQHKNVSNPDGQMMSQQGSKITMLHVERNGIPVGTHRQCHNTSCFMHTKCTA